MKLIIDTEKKLEYFYAQKVVFTNKFYERLDYEKLSENLVNIDSYKYFYLLQCADDDLIKTPSSFPIGTIFSTLYNLSILTEKELDNVLKSVSEKNFSSMNFSELFTFYLLYIFGEEKIKLDLALANHLYFDFGPISFTRDRDDIVHMIPKHFLSLTKEDRLILCKTQNLDFVIEDNIKTSKSNYISVFFCIFSYFLLSFCVSFLNHVSNKVLEFLNKKPTHISNTYEYFTNIISNNNAPLNSILDILQDEFNLNEGEKYLIDCYLCEKWYWELNIDILSLYENIFNYLVDSLDFNYPYTKNRLETDSEDNVSNFFINITPYLNDILEIYNHYQVEVIKGINEQLPLIFEFTPRTDLLENMNNEFDWNLNYFEEYIDSINNETSDINWEVLNELIYMYDTSPPVFSTKNTFTFNTQPSTTIIKTNNNPSDPYNHMSSPFIDIFLAFFLMIFIYDDPKFTMSLCVSHFYSNYFDYFSFLRQYTATKKIFPNENLISIDCYNFKDLLTASFYVSTIFGEYKEEPFPFNDEFKRNKKNRFYQSSSSFSSSNKNTNKISDITYSGKDFLTPSKLQQLYKNYQVNIEFPEKENIIKNFFSIKGKLYDLKSESIDILTKKNQNNIQYVLNYLFKVSYTLLLKIDFERLIISQREQLQIRFIFKNNFPQFKSLTRYKKGISPLAVTKKYLETSEKSSSLNHDDKYTIKKENDDTLRLYKLTMNDDLYSSIFSPFQYSDYLNLIDMTKNLFINVVLDLYYCQIKKKHFLDSKNENELFQKHSFLNDEEFEKEEKAFVEWAKDYNVYNGIQTVLSELSRIKIPNNLHVSH